MVKNYLYNVAEGHVALKLQVKQLTLKLKALKSSEKALYIYHSTRSNILKDIKFHYHHLHEKLKIL